MGNPITATFGVEATTVMNTEIKNVDMGNVDNTEIDIYVGIKPNIL